MKKLFTILLVLGCISCNDNDAEDNLENIGDSIEVKTERLGDSIENKVDRWEDSLDRDDSVR